MSSECFFNSAIFTTPNITADCNFITFTNAEAAKNFFQHRRKKTFITVQVKSNTVQGNRHHSREHVIANIVKANIPVANGIVHLIDRPLIVVASPLWKYLEEEVDIVQKIVIQLE